MKTNSTTAKPGRPAKTADSDDRRVAILDSAEQQFAARGYAATSIRQIAEQANSNPALVHYYFRNKQDLMIAVMERVLEPMADALGSIREMPGDVLANVVRLFMNTLAQHPAMPQLMAREVLLPGGEMQQYFIEHFSARLGGALPGLIRVQQRRGVIRDNLEPALLALNVMGLCVFPFLARSMAEPVLEIDYSPAALENMVLHTLALLQTGVMK